jgi:hypothetical protein
MGGGSSNISRISQNTTNQLLQSNTQACIQNSETVTDGNVTIINNSNIAGDVIGVRQHVSVDFTCNITASMDQTVSSMLQSISKQTATANNDLLGGIQVSRNRIDLSQSMVNNMSQINNSICSTNSIASSSNNFTYVGNSNVGGSVIGVEQTVNPRSQCTVNTITKMAAYNQIQGNVDQTSNVVGLLPSIFSGLAGIITLVIIGVIIVSVLGAVGYLIYAVVGGRAPKAPGETGFDQSIAQQIASGDIPPDELARLEAGYQNSSATKTANLPLDSGSSTDLTISPEQELVTGLD